MTIKQKIIDNIIAVEGGYVNNPKDGGGETNFGITIAVARANGWTGPMRDLPRSKAFEIYSAQYWDINNLDQIEVISPKLAEELADTGVNMGPATAAIFLQKALNLLNRGSKDFPNIPTDGKIGGQTVKSLRAFINLRGDNGIIVLLRMLNAMQGARYIEIASQATDDKDEEFIFGWFLNRVSI